MSFGVTLFCVIALAIASFFTAFCSGTRFSAVMSLMFSEPVNDSIKAKLNKDLSFVALLAFLSAGLYVLALTISAAYMH